MDVQPADAAACVRLTDLELSGVARGRPGYPHAPEEIVYPSRSTPGYRWKDISPRIGVVRPVREREDGGAVQPGQYMEAITATNNDLDMNPLVRTVVRTTRGWTDTNRDYAPDCDLMNPAANGECARMDNQNLGRQVFNRSFDPTTSAAGCTALQLERRPLGTA